MSEALEALWRQVAHVAQERVALLERAVEGLRGGDAGLQPEAESECHKLIGALDSYGRTGGSALATRAQGLFAQQHPDLGELADVVGQLRALVGP